MRKNKLITPFICSLFGLLVEILMRAISGTMIGLFGLSYFSLAGWTSLVMIPVYFIGFYLIMELHDKTNLSMFDKTIVGGFLIAMVELISGVFLNIYPLQLNAWHYEYLHILNQIWVGNYILFTASIPFAIWLSDLIDFVLYDDYRLKYGIFDNYKELLRKK